MNTPHPKAALNRADLLRLLQLWGEGAEHAAASLTGYKYEPPQIADEITEQEDLAPKEMVRQTKVNAPIQQPRLQAQHYYATLSSIADVIDEAYQQRLENPDTESLDDFPTAPPPAWQALTPNNRLTVFAEKYLRHLHPVNLWDSQKLMRKLSQGLPPIKRRTRQQRLRWAGNVVVMYMSRQTEPLHNDYRALAELIHRRSAGRVLIYLHYEEHGWSIYQPRAGMCWRKIAAAPSLRGQTGLLVGCAPSTFELVWQPRVALLACAANDSTAQICWDFNSRLHAQRQIATPQLYASNEQLQTLLALIALAVIIHPPLLRALRSLLKLPVGAEVQAWNHVDVGNNGVAIAIRREKRNDYLIKELPKISLTAKQQACALIAAHHSQLSREIILEESQLAHAHVEHAPVMHPAAHFKQIRAKLAQNPDEEVAAYFARAGHRADEKTWLESPEFALVWAQANPHVLDRQDTLPAHFPLALREILKGQMTGQAITERYGLRFRQQDDQLIFECVASEQLAQPAPLPANVLAQWPSRAILQWRSGTQTWQRLTLGREDFALDLALLAPIEIEDGFQRCVVERAERPDWAQEWGRDRYGVYANLTIQNITQTLRYIPHGQFLMGSPDSEPERGSDEGPQHWVTISAGFWLADTACTQSLWQAVMWNNPSHFKGGDLPVENVSWNDVQQFLAKLQQVLPKGVEAVLPTEAQWEYACRAGTQTPFSFGDNISTDQVNYDGRDPYHHGAVGEYRRRTVVVRALPANNWGLYQMHGNVREWCADGQREYTEAPVTDPNGALNDTSRVVRGGCWFNRAQSARSAQRYQGLSVDSLLYLGFRFALRFQAQVAGGQSVRSSQAPQDGVWELETPSQTNVVKSPAKKRKSKKRKSKK